MKHTTGCCWLFGLKLWKQNKGLQASLDILLRNKAISLLFFVGELILLVAHSSSGCWLCECMCQMCPANKTNSIQLEIFSNNSTVPHPLPST